jgi:hypothetical protein
MSCQEETAVVLLPMSEGKILSPPYIPHKCEGCVASCSRGAGFQRSGLLFGGYSRITFRPDIPVCYEGGDDTHAMRV